MMLSPSWSRFSSLKSSVSQKAHFCVANFAFPQTLTLMAWISSCISVLPGIIPIASPQPGSPSLLPFTGVSLSLSVSLSLQISYWCFFSFSYFSTTLCYSHSDLNRALTSEPIHGILLWPESHFLSNQEIAIHFSQLPDITSDWFTLILSCIPEI